MFSGSKLRTLRLAAGLSSTQLAAAVGVSESTIHRAERGAFEPRATTVARIAGALDCRMEELFDAEPAAA
jgi:transcriptional regulator with XRE-family HTH domain